MQKTRTGAHTALVAVKSVAFMVAAGGEAAPRSVGAAAAAPVAAAATFGFATGAARLDVPTASAASVVLTANSVAAGNILHTKVAEAKKPAQQAK